MEEKERWFVESFARGLAVMRALGQGAGPLRLSRIAEISGIPRAATRRLLKTLEALEYVGVQEGQFYLRARALDLGYAYLSSISVEQAVQPYLEELAAGAQGSSSVGVLDAGEIVHVAHASTQNRFRLVSVIGSRLPAYALSLGRIILANLPAEMLERYFAAATFSALTPHTNSDVRKLREVLAIERARGWAGCKDESVIGITAIAVPLHNPRGAVTAAVNLSLMGEPVSPDELADRHLPMLRARR